jgi:hypothetical protein
MAANKDRTQTLLSHGGSDGTTLGEVIQEGNDAILVSKGLENE